MGLSFCASRNRVFFVIVVLLGFLLLWTYSGNVFVNLTSSLKSPKPAIELSWGSTEEFRVFKNVTSSKISGLNLKFLHSPEPCYDDDILAVIIVTSHFNNVETRSAMRRTVDQYELTNLKLRRLFLIGQSLDSAYMTQASLTQESKRFGDIVQGNFLEAYRNLTYKHVMGLRWVSEHCHSAKYVIKMDDDIVFNVKEVVTLLNKIHLPQNSIAGYILRNMIAIREPANKWFVTQEEYKFSKYPTFVSGWFYVTTPKVARNLFLMSHYYKYFWIDDVYVTGILAKKLKIKLFDLSKYFTAHSEFLQCCLTDLKKLLYCDILVGPNGGDSNLFYEFNVATKICEFEHCEKRLKPLNETCVAEKKTNLMMGNVIIENYKLR